MDRQRYPSIVTSSLLGIGLGMLVLAVFCVPCGAEGLDPLTATKVAVIAAEEPLKGENLTDEQKKYLSLRQAVLDRSLEDAQASWKPYEHILGKGRCRELERTLFRYRLVSPAYGHDLWQSYAMDDMADTVLSAYAKIQRENLEDLLGVDEWLDRKRPASTRKSSRPTGPSYKLRISPRLSSDYLGVKFRMPYTGLESLNHLNFRVRYDFDEARPIYMLKFDNHSRFMHFSYEPDTETFGDLFNLSLRFVW